MVSNNGFTRDARFVDSVKEGLSFERKRDWYSALRGVDAMIRQGELAKFRKFDYESPCRCDPDFHANLERWLPIRRGVLIFVKV